jgi:hypothetical protein
MVRDAVSILALRHREERAEHRRSRGAYAKIGAPSRRSPCCSADGCLRAHGRWKVRLMNEARARKRAERVRVD